MNTGDNSGNIKRDGMRNTMTIILTTVLLTCLLIPVNVFAEVSLTQKDFTEAQNHPGTVTSKGVSYVQIIEDYTYYSFEPGTYKLAEDIIIDESTIEIKNSGEYVFDLNGKAFNRTGTISGFFFFSGGKLTITGNGSMDNYPGLLALSDCDVVIDNGTLSGVVSCSSKNGSTSLTINNATVNGTTWLTGEKTTGIIHDGTFYDKLNPVLLISDGAVLTVNNGTFTSDMSGLEASNVTETTVSGKPAKSIIINGGTFKTTGSSDNPAFPSMGGLYLESIDEVTLNGGTFVAEGNAAGAIVASVNPKSPNKDFENFLGNGYQYSEDLQLKKADENGLYASQKTISVIPARKSDNFSQYTVLGPPAA